MINENCSGDPMISIPHHLPNRLAICFYDWNGFIASHSDETFRRLGKSCT